MYCLSLGVKDVKANARFSDLSSVYLQYTVDAENEASL